MEVNENPWKNNMSLQQNLQLLSNNMQGGVSECGIKSFIETLAGGSGSKPFIDNRATKCICGIPGQWYNRMLECQKCKQWHHGTCIGSLKYKLICGDRFYLYICKGCNNGTEILHRLPMTWHNLAHLALWNLSISKNYPATFGKYFEYEKEISIWVKNNGSTNFQNIPIVDIAQHILLALKADQNTFKCGKEVRKKNSIWGLRILGPPLVPEMILPPGAPINEASIPKITYCERRTQLPPVPKTYKVDEAEAGTIYLIQQEKNSDIKSKNKGDNTLQPLLDPQNAVNKKGEFSQPQLLSNTIMMNNERVGKVLENKVHNDHDDDEEKIKIEEWDENNEIPEEDLNIKVEIEGDSIHQALQDQKNIGNVKSTLSQLQFSYNTSLVNNEEDEKAYKKLIHNDDDEENIKIEEWNVMKEIKEEDSYMKAEYMGDSIFQPLLVSQNAGNKKNAVNHLHIFSNTNLLNKERDGKALTDYVNGDDNHEEKIKIEEWNDMDERSNIENDHKRCSILHPQNECEKTDFDKNAFGQIPVCNEKVVEDNGPIDNEPAIKKKKMTEDSMRKYYGRQVATVATDNEDDEEMFQEDKFATQCSMGSKASISYKDDPAIRLQVGDHFPCRTAKGQDGKHLSKSCIFCHSQTVKDYKGNKGVPSTSVQCLICKVPLCIECWIPFHKYEDYKNYNKNMMQDHSISSFNTHNVLETTEIQESCQPRL